MRLALARSVSICAATSTCRSPARSTPLAFPWSNSKLVAPPRDGKIEIRGYPFFWERRAGQTALLDRALERRVGPVKGFNSFRVDVSDPGLGIPAEHIDRIFEEYTSYRGGLDRSGGGIGLAICRMILHRHKGASGPKVTLQVPCFLSFSLFNRCSRTTAKRRTVLGPRVWPGAWRIKCPSTITAARSF